MEYYLVTPKEWNFDVCYTTCILLGTKPNLQSFSWTFLPASQVCILVFF